MNAKSMVTVEELTTTGTQRAGVEGFLSPATLELLRIVLELGGEEDHSRLQPGSHYLFSLNPDDKERNALHDAAVDDLQEIVMDITRRQTAGT